MSMSYCLSPVVLFSLLLLHAHPARFHFRDFVVPSTLPSLPVNPLPRESHDLSPPFHWGLSRSLAHGASAFPDCFLWSGFFVFYIHPPWFGFLQSSLLCLTWYILLYIYLFLWSLRPLLESETSVRGLFVCFFPVVFFVFCVSSIWTVTGTLWVLKR